ncbi:MAG: hypothetical protein K2I71_02625, partial [Helicobacter sp.]|nr:hypothetical protein [Helicobacter sp.]
MFIHNTNFIESYYAYECKISLLWQNLYWFSLEINPLELTLYITLLFIFITIENIIQSKRVRIKGKS